jgi:hypothetical protein
MVASTHQAALAEYLALGADRSLAKLHRGYGTDGVENAPCLKTLANWSKRYRWQAAVTEHDEYVGAALLLRLRETAVQQQYDHVSELHNLAQLCLDTALETATNLRPMTASDLRILATIAIDAIKMVEVLTGGIKERREDYSKGIDPAAMAILEQMAADKRAGIEIRFPREVDTLPARKN